MRGGRGGSRWRMPWPDSQSFEFYVGALLCLYMAIQHFRRGSFIGGVALLIWTLLFGVLGPRCV